MEPIHELWSGLLVRRIALYIIYQGIRFVVFVPVGIVVFLLVIIPSVAKLIGSSQQQWGSATAKRVGLTTSIVKAIRAVNISGLETRFIALPDSLREKESAALHKFGMVETCVRIPIPSTSYS